MASASNALSSGGGLGERPDPVVVEESRNALERIDSELAWKAEVISSLPHPSNMDIVVCQAAKAAMQEEAKRIAEKEKERYKAVIQLEELYQMFDDVVKRSSIEIVEESKSQTISAAEAAPLSKNGSLKLDSDQLLQELRGLILFNVPDSAQKLSAVSKLDLSTNNMENLPEAVTSLENLRILDIHSNQLTSLPRSMGRLTKLKVLNVSGNLLSEFPESVQDCSSLEELTADFNQLTRLPESLGFELLRLRKLSLRSNKLTFLPASISYMASLRVLDVHMNKLIYLPEDIENLVNLQILNVSHNFDYLDALPASIGGLMSLVELDASYNQIREIPDSFRGLEELKRLNLEGNPLITPPPHVVKAGIQAVNEFLRKRANKSSLRRNLSCLVAGRCVWPGCKVIYKNVVGGKDKATTWQECGDEEEDDRFGSSRCFFTPSRSPSTPQRTPHYLYSPRYSYS